jgi:sugar porter (SP) family MFS transporter
MVGFIADEAKLWFGKKQQFEHQDEEPKRDHVDNLKNYLPHYDKYWWSVPHLLKLNSLILIISLTSTNTGYDGSLLNAFQAMPDWMAAMGEPSGAVLGAIANGVVFGVLLSTSIASPLSDRYGRRNAITIGNIIMIIGTIIQSCAGTWLTVKGEHDHNSKSTYAMFLVARIILGFGNGLATISSPPLISELSYPSHRQAVTAFFNSNWYLGAIISSWVSFGTRNVGSNWSWRIPSIIQGFFPLVQGILIYLVPESPRFLISKGRNEEARSILMKYHGGNDEDKAGALIDFEMSEIELAIEQEKFANKFSYKSFLETPGNRKRLFLLTWIGITMQLSGNGLVSYYLAKVLDSIGIKSTSQQLVFNGGLMIYNYGISIIINLFAFNTTKRRTTFITSVAAMLLTYVIWTILSAINQQRNFEDKSLGKGVMAMIFLYYLAYNYGLNGLPYLYLTEILPFTIRTKGINLCVLVQQVVQIYNGFVNPIAMDAIEWKYYIVYCCILGVELVVVFLTYVETSGRTLEEVAEVFGESINDIDIDHLKAKAVAEHAEDASSESVEKDNNLLL